MAIATRSALRALPALAAALGPRDGGARRLGRAIVLPVFRANAISFAAAISSRPQADLVIASVSAATSIREASYGFLRSSIPNLSAEDLYALLSARAAIETVVGSVRREFSRRGDIIDHAAHAAGNAADAIRHASGLTHAASWESISADANLINRGTKASELISQPLWPGRNPDWLQEENWDRLKHSLLTLNEGWMVWTEWYEARLEGRLPNEALEIARALIDDEFWQKGPQAISAEIRRLTKKRVSNIKKDSQPLDRPSGAR